MKVFTVYRETNLFKLEQEPIFRLGVRASSESKIRLMFPCLENSLAGLAAHHYEYSKHNEDFRVNDADEVVTLTHPTVNCSPSGILKTPLTAVELADYYLAYCRNSGLIKKPRF